MKHILTFLLLVAINIIYSQNTIKGTVKDSQTSEVISFANIYIPQLEKGTVSDENGNFIISQVPSGSYKIVFSIIGYEAVSQTINTP